VPTLPADGSVSSPRSAAPSPTAPRSACPPSPAPRPWTARSCTGTATCSARSTPPRLARPLPAAAPARPSTRASLQADLLAAHERAVRLHARIQQLEKRLSEVLGDQAWRESGLGAPADIDTLDQRIIHLEQQVTGQRLQLEERDEELAAARAANRELMAQLNAGHHR
jgi:hypothetical protein